LLFAIVPPLFDLKLIWLVAHVGCQVLLVQGLAQELEQVMVKVSETGCLFKKKC